MAIVCDNIHQKYFRCVEKHFFSFFFDHFFFARKPFFIMYKSPFLSKYHLFVFFNLQNIAGKLRNRASMINNYVACLILLFRAKQDQIYFNPKARWAIAVLIHAQSLLCAPSLKYQKNCLKNCLRAPCNSKAPWPHLSLNTSPFTPSSHWQLF